MAKKVLVVDDDEGILEAFDAMLTTAGYAVKTTSNADYVQALTINTKPDLILLDVLLSGQDGRDICKHLKEHKKTKHIPIIMVSAHPSASRTIKNVGADDFLAKPFEMEDLLKKIEKHISIQH